MVAVLAANLEQFDAPIELVEVRLDLFRNPSQKVVRHRRAQPCLCRHLADRQRLQRVNATQYLVDTTCDLLACRRDDHAVAPPLEEGEVQLALQSINRMGDVLTRREALPCRPREARVVRRRQEITQLLNLHNGPTPKRTIGSARRCRGVASRGFCAPSHYPMILFRAPFRGGNNRLYPTRRSLRAFKEPEELTHGGSVRFQRQNAGQPHHGSLRLPLEACLPPLALVAIRSRRPKHRLPSKTRYEAAVMVPCGCGFATA